MRFAHPHESSLALGHEWLLNFDGQILQMAQRRLWPSTGRVPENVGSEFLSAITLI